MNLNFDIMLVKYTSWIKGFFIFFAFSLTTCVDPYKGDIKFSGPKLAIEGHVTDAYGAYKVSILQSVAYNSTDGSVPVQNAVVYVRDDKGARYAFQHVNRGVYTSDPLEFRGESGRTYTLHVELPDGRKIESKPALLRAAPTIDSAFTRPVVKKDYRGIETAEFSVLAQVRDGKETGDYYRWNWARYEEEVYCKTKIVGELVTSFKNPCCRPCWKIAPCRGCILLFSDNLVNGNLIEYPIGSIPYDSQDDYFMGLELYRISETTYRFWKTASTQVNNTGGIFDAPPAALPGNLFNPADSTEQVLGIFSASGVSKKGVYLKRDYLNFFPPNIQIGFQTQILSECVECEESLYRTRFRPLGW